MSRKQSPRSFWARVDRRGSGECWEWQGATNSSGYGTVVWFGKLYTAHRSAAWLTGVVDDLSAPAEAATPTHVLHKCDNRRCCNPNHLFLGSLSDNMYDAYFKNRKAQPKGEQHTNSKLTNAQANEVRLQYSRGARQVDLAREYHVSQKVISNIVRGVSYNA